MSPEGALKLKTWHHAAFTYDGADLKVYLDGQQVASEAINKKRKPGHTSLAIGRRQDAYNYFKGAIDEVRLYPRPLPADELKAHFDKPGAKDAQAPAASFPFDDLGKLDAAANEVMEQAGPEPPYRERLGLQGQ